MTTTIIGNYLSPYVRKVLAVLNLKGIPYKIDPLIPYLGNDEFSIISPLRGIPVLIDDQITIADSSVICQYLEERYPNKPIFPQNIGSRAKARYFEEYADTRIGDIVIWQYYLNKVIRPFVWGKPAKEDVIRNAEENEFPQIFDYLESQLPDQGFLFGDLSLADIAISVFFRNLYFAQFQIDAARWPKLYRFVQNTLDQDCLAQLRKFEESCIRTPIQHHRSKLKELGAPISERTWIGDSPRRGIIKRAID